MKKAVFKFVFAALLAALVSCSQKKSTNIVLSSDSSSDSVTQILNHSTISAFRQGEKHWELTASEIMQMRESGQTRASPVLLTIFSESGEVNAVLVADSGRANQRTDTLFVWGNVKINATSGEVLLAQTLEWQQRQKLLVSKDFVELRSADGEIMRGRGFRAAENFSWWDFDNEVSGNFPSIYNELERDD